MRLFACKEDGASFQSIDPHEVPKAVHVQDAVQQVSRGLENGRRGVLICGHTGIPDSTPVLIDHVMVRRLAGVTGQNKVIGPAADRMLLPSCLQRRISEGQKQKAGFPGAASLAMLPPMLQ